MKTKITFLISFLIACVPYLKTQGQNSYTFSRIPPGTIPYQELTLDSDVTAITDSVGYFILDSDLAGEVFHVFNVPGTIGVNSSILLGDNGFLEIVHSAILRAAIFDAGFTLLSTIDSTSRMSYSITGTSGNLVVKMQFKNWKLTNGPPGNYANYQIWLHQQSGVIEFHYGARSANNVSGYSVSNGPNVGAFYTPTDFSGCIAKLWCNGNPNNPSLDSTANYVFLALQGLPDSGTVYRFSPQFPVGIGQDNIDPIPTLDLFPTLTSENIYVEIKSGLSAQTAAVVLDITGRIVKSVMLETGLNEINVSDLNKGLYFFSTNQHQINKAQKFIKIDFNN